MRIALRAPVGIALVAGLIIAACTGGTANPPAATAATAATAAATSTPKPTARLGSFDRPLILAFVPSQETQKVLKSGDTIASALSQATGLKFKAQVPASYAATIEGMCSGKVDVAFLTPLSYVLARSKGCADYMTTSVRFGAPTYRGQIRVRADSGITDLAGLKGKRFAFSDPVSTSGSMYPQLLVKKQFNMTA
ncbi:MAG: phosphate/phosphite/phosphonate ABC transporter substrate-binding protein, partial [Chloroflexota bacterium]